MDRIAIPSAIIPTIFARFSRDSLFIPINVYRLDILSRKNLIFDKQMIYIMGMKKKTESFLIRVTEEEKSGFWEAASLAGIPLSTWARERLRLAAIQELQNAGRKVPFIAPLPLGEPDE